MKSFDIGKLPKEAIFSLLMQVDPEEIGIVCSQTGNAKVKQVCESQYFQDAYWAKHSLVEAPRLGFSKPSLLTKNFLEFLRQADFGEDNIKIHELINPSLDEGILSKNVLIVIMGLYFKKSQYKENGRLYYKADNLLNFYFKDCLTVLEEEKKFDRNKIQFGQIHNIIQCGIEKNLNMYQKTILSNKMTIKMIQNISDKIKEILYR